jgi:hypothetical protein
MSESAPNPRFVFLLLYCAYDLGPCLFDSAAVWMATPVILFIYLTLVCGDTRITFEGFHGKKACIASSRTI